MIFLFFFLKKSNCKLKRLLKLTDGNHNNTWLCPGYFQFISKFIQEVLFFKIKNLLFIWLILINCQKKKIKQTTAMRTSNSNSSNPNSMPINSQIWHVNSR